MKSDKHQRKPIVKLGLKLRRVVNRILVKQSKVGDPPVFDTAVFPWTRELEANWETIRDEAYEIMRHRDAVPPLSDVSPDHRKIATDQSWQCMFLWGYGIKVPANCARAPKTASIVQKIPGMRSALFSIHAPGLHIPRHKGVTKSMLTCHLALKVPREREKCRIQVDEQFLVWEEGKTIVFDDVYHHEVWNDTDDDRIILLVQFDRPVSWFGKLVGDSFLSLVRWSPFIQEARTNLQDWERRYKESEAARDKAA